MKTRSTGLTKAIATIVGLVIVGIVLLFAVRWFYSAFVSAGDNVKTATIGGLFAIAAVIAAYFRESRLKRIESHREQKVELYKIFFDFVNRIVRENAESGSANWVESDEFRIEMIKFKSGLMFYGSPKVILAFNEFQRGDSNETAGIEVVNRVGNVFLAMREDIGLSNWNLTAASLNQVIVKEQIS